MNLLSSLMISLMFLLSHLILFLAAEAISFDMILKYIEVPHNTEVSLYSLSLMRKYGLNLTSSHIRVSFS